MTRENLTLTLTHDEALVLFEWLSAYHDSATISMPDAAEKRALWNLEACLESVLTDPLESDYEERLLLAKARLADMH
jgi:hypothetical protein